MPKISIKCQECSKLQFKRMIKSEPVSIKPKCFKLGNCRKKRNYYRHLERYRASMLNRHRYLKFKGDHCALCESTIQLEVHHITSQEHNGMDSRMNTITLCHKCHRTITNYYNAVGWTTRGKNSSQLPFYVDSKKDIQDITTLPYLD
jgi:hypothetical protein